MSAVSPQSAAAAPSPVLGNLPPGDGMPGGPMPPGFFQVSFLSCTFNNRCPSAFSLRVKQQAIAYTSPPFSLLLNTHAHTRAIRFEPAHTGAIMPPPLVIRQAPGVLRESV